MYLADIFTIAANLAGICGISIPCGFAQVDGRDSRSACNFSENLLMSAPAEHRPRYEQSTNWHKRRPPNAL